MQGRPGTIKEHTGRTFLGVTNNRYNFPSKNRQETEGNRAAAHPPVYASALGTCKAEANPITETTPDFLLPQQHPGV